MLSRDAIYVARLWIPCGLSGHRSIRGSVPSDSPFNVTRGYWGVEWRSDAQGTEHPVGLYSVVQFFASDRAEAEDTALGIGSRLATLATLFAGSPLQEPRLVRLASVNASGQPISQWEYFYQVDSPFHPPVPVVLADFQSALDRYVRLDENRRRAFELGCRWYGLSVGAVGVVDSLLAAWVGLEAVGPSLDRRFHKDRAAPCNVCDHAGGKRNRGLAGIEHVLNRVVPELVARIGVEKIHELRNQIAHGYKPIEEVNTLAAEIVPDLQLALGSATLTCLGSEGDGIEAWTAPLPGEYSFHPDLRLGVAADKALERYEPWSGNWLSVLIESNHEASGSTCTDDGDYLARPIYRIVVEYDQRRRQQAPKVELTPFARRGMEIATFEPPGSSLAGLVSNPAEPWRPTTLSPLAESP